nr:hypothetical protein Iba_chr12dCG9210 [Ipomoea batatas]
MAMKEVLTWIKERLEQEFIVETCPILLTKLKLQRRHEELIRDSGQLRIRDKTAADTANMGVFGDEEDECWLGFGPKSLAKEGPAAATGAEAMGMSASSS